MTGRLIAVVGPSGVGKDSVMEAAAMREPRLTVVRRVITRPSSAGGEKFDGVSEADFRRRQAEGEFALSWQAHGLFYGIPVTIEQQLGDGLDVLANLSRAVLGDAKARFGALLVLNLTASREVLSRRLTARGRETQDQIDRRLSRTPAPLPTGMEVITVDNSGELEQTVDHVLGALYPPSAYRSI